MYADLPSEEERSCSSLHTISGPMSAGTSSSSYSKTGGSQYELVRLQIPCAPGGKTPGFATASSGQEEAEERGAESPQGRQHYTFVRRWLQLTDLWLIPPAEC